MLPKDTFCGCFGVACLPPPLSLLPHGWTGNVASSTAWLTLTNAEKAALFKHEGEAAHKLHKAAIVGQGSNVCTCEMGGHLPFSLSSCLAVGKHTSALLLSCTSAS